MELQPCRNDRYLALPQGGHDRNPVTALELWTSTLFGIVGTCLCTGTSAICSTVRCRTHSCRAHFITGPVSPKIGDTGTSMILSVYWACLTSTVSSTFRITGTSRIQSRNGTCGISTVFCTWCAVGTCLCCSPGTFTTLSTNRVQSTSTALRATRTVTEMLTTDSPKSSRSCGCVCSCCFSCACSCACFTCSVCCLAMGLSPTPPRRSATMFKFSWHNTLSVQRS